MAYDKCNLELDSSIAASSIPARINIDARVPPWGLRLFRSADISEQVIPQHPFQFVACIMNLIFSGNYICKVTPRICKEKGSYIGQLLKYISKSLFRYCLWKVYIIPLIIY